MNTIIIPTDFSATAENAMHYGAKLAGLMNASVLLVHVYQVPINMNEAPVMMIAPEELKNSADKGLERLREELQQAYNGLNVAIESRLGDLNEELQDLCKERDPFAVVIGSKGIRGFERMLFGNTSLSVIRHAHYPVITVPEKYTGFATERIVLAADFKTDAPLPVEHIKTIVRELKAKLHIVHIAQEGDTSNPDAFLHQLKEINTSYKSIAHSDVLKGLQTFMQQEAADMLLIFPHDHTLFERLFFRLHAEDIITSLEVPVMAIKC